MTRRPSHRAIAAPIRARTAQVMVASLLLWIAPSAFARSGADPACESAAQRSDLVAARAELQHAPDALAKRVKLGDLLLGAGCYDEAIQVLKAGEALDPGNPELQYRLNRAYSLMRERQYFEGLGQARAATHSTRSALRCTQLSDVAACDEILAQHPGSVEITVARGNALLSANRIDEAIAAYVRATQLAPNSVLITQKLTAAQSLRQTIQRRCSDGSAEDAIRACRALLVRGAPDEFETTVRIAGLQQSAGQLSQALDSYIAADSIRPGDLVVARAILALLDGTQRQDPIAVAARGSAAQTLAREARAKMLTRNTVAQAQAPTLKVAEAAPQRSSFSNRAPPSRSN